MTKAGLQRTAAALGLMVIAPDTSPRGDDVPDDPAYDLGKGAGFYLTATQQPWAKHYRMDQYVADELQARRRRQFPRGRSRAPRHHRSFDGRSRCADAAPEASAALSLRFSVLADRGAVAGAVGAEGVHGVSRQRSQRVAELRCDRARQEAAVDRAHPDRPGCRGSISGARAATAAIRRRGKVSGPAGDAAMQEGYDHSYYFVSTFIDDHLRWHAQATRRSGFSPTTFRRAAPCSSRTRDPDTPARHCGSALRANPPARPSADPSSG